MVSYCAYLAKCPVRRRRYLAPLLPRVFASLQDSLEKAIGSTLHSGVLVAFAVAATQFSFAGITSALWAVVEGLAASLIAERGELLTHRRERPG